jgi:GNAT superfamily N-acetyltransferase
MVITFKPTEDFATAAQLTLDNMREYYEHYDVEWDAAQIETMTRELHNIDLLWQGQWVGVMRLSFDDEVCQLRDLQVVATQQNKGLGALAIAEAERLAKALGKHSIALKVFKISPAFRLYLRLGFQVTSEDERFYYMNRSCAI